MRGQYDDALALTTYVPPRRGGGAAALEPGGPTASREGLNVHQGAINKARFPERRELEYGAGDYNESGGVSGGEFDAYESRRTDAGFSPKHDLDYAAEGCCLQRNVPASYSSIGDVFPFIALCVNDETEVERFLTAQALFRRYQSDSQALEFERLYRFAAQQHCDVQYTLPLPRPSLRSPSPSLCGLEGDRIPPSFIGVLQDHASTLPNGHELIEEIADAGENGEIGVIGSANEEDEGEEFGTRFGTSIARARKAYERLRVNTKGSSDPIGNMRIGEDFLGEYKYTHFPKVTVVEDGVLLPEAAVQDESLSGGSSASVLDASSETDRFSVAAATRQGYARRGVAETLRQRLAGGLPWALGRCPPSLPPNHPLTARSTNQRHPLKNRPGNSCFTNTAVHTSLDAITADGVDGSLSRLQCPSIAEVKSGKIPEMSNVVEGALNLRADQDDPEAVLLAMTMSSAVGQDDRTSSDFHHEIIGQSALDSPGFDSPTFDPSALENFGGGSAQMNANASFSFQDDDLPYADGSAKRTRLDDAEGAKDTQSSMLWGCASGPVDTMYRRAELREQLDLSEVQPGLERVMDAGSRFQAGATVGADATTAAIADALVARAVDLYQEQTIAERSAELFRHYNGHSFQTVIDPKQAVLLQTMVADMDIFSMEDLTDGVLSRGQGPGGVRGQSLGVPELLRRRLAASMRFLLQTTTTEPAAGGQPGQRRPGPEMPPMSKALTAARAREEDRIGGFALWRAIGEILYAYHPQTMLSDATTKDGDAGTGEVGNKATDTSACQEGASGGPGRHGGQGNPVVPPVQVSTSVPAGLPAGSGSGPDREGQADTAMDTQNSRGRDVSTMRSRGWRIGANDALGRKFLALHRDVADPLHNITRRTDLARLPLNWLQISCDKAYAAHDPYRPVADQVAGDVVAASNTIRHAPFAWHFHEVVPKPSSAQIARTFRPDFRVGLYDAFCYKEGLKHRSGFAVGGSASSSLVSGGYGFGGAMGVGRPGSKGSQASSLLSGTKNFLQSKFTPRSTYYPYGKERGLAAARSAAARATGPTGDSNRPGSRAGSQAGSTVGAHGEVFGTGDVPGVQGGLDGSVDQRYDSLLAGPWTIHPPRMCQLDPATHMATHVMHTPGDVFHPNDVFTTPQTLTLGEWCHTLLLEHTVPPPVLPAPGMGSKMKRYYRPSKEAFTNLVQAEKKLRGRLGFFGQLRLLTDRSPPLFGCPLRIRPNQGIALIQNELLQGMCFSQPFDPRKPLPSPPPTPLPRQNADTNGSRTTNETSHLRTDDHIFPDHSAPNHAVPDHSVPELSVPDHSVWETLLHETQDTRLTDFLLVRASGCHATRDRVRLTLRPLFLGCSASAAASEDGAKAAPLAALPPGFPTKLTLPAFCHASSSEELELLQRIEEVARMGVYAVGQCEPCMDVPVPDGKKFGEIRKEWVKAYALRIAAEEGITEMAAVKQRCLQRFSSVLDTSSAHRLLLSLKSSLEPGAGLLAGGAGTAVAIGSGPHIKVSSESVIQRIISPELLCLMQSTMYGHMLLQWHGLAILKSCDRLAVARMLLHHRDHLNDLSWAKALARYHAHQNTRQNSLQTQQTDNSIISDVNKSSSTAATTARTLESVLFGAAPPFRGQNPCSTSALATVARVIEEMLLATPWMQRKGFADVVSRKNTQFLLESAFDPSLGRLETLVLMKEDVAAAALKDPLALHFFNAIGPERVPLYPPFEQARREDFERLSLQSLQLLLIRLGLPVYKLARMGKQRLANLAFRLAFAIYGADAAGHANGSGAREGSESNLLPSSKRADETESRAGVNFSLAALSHLGRPEQLVSLVNQPARVDLGDYHTRVNEVLFKQRSVLQSGLRSSAPSAAAAQRLSAEPDIFREAFAPPLDEAAVEDSFLASLEGATPTRAGGNSEGVGGAARGNGESTKNGSSPAPSVSAEEAARNVAQSAHDAFLVGKVREVYRLEHDRAAAAEKARERASGATRNAGPIGGLLMSNSKVQVVATKWLQSLPDEDSVKSFLLEKARTGVPRLKWVRQGALAPSMSSGSSRSKIVYIYGEENILSFIKWRRKRLVAKVAMRNLDTAGSAVSSTRNSLILTAGDPFESQERMRSSQAQSHKPKQREQAKGVLEGKDVDKTSTSVINAACRSHPEGSRTKEGARMEGRRESGSSLGPLANYPAAVKTNSNLGKQTHSTRVCKRCGKSGHISSNPRCPLFGTAEPLSAVAKGGDLGGGLVQPGAGLLSGSAGSGMESFALGGRGWPGSNESAAQQSDGEPVLPESRAGLPVSALRLTARQQRLLEDRHREAKAAGKELPSSLVAFSGTPDAALEELSSNLTKLVTSLRRPEKKFDLFWDEVRDIDAPNYSQIVKNPMWLNRVLEKLKDKDYRTVKDFLDDIQRIHESCFAYNPAGHWIRPIADQLVETVQKRIEGQLVWLGELERACNAGL